MVDWKPKLTYVALCKSFQLNMDWVKASDRGTRLQGMGRTLFERLHGLYGNDVSQMLTVQYRMHEDIMAWASAALYHNLLTAHPSVAHHTLATLQVSSFLT